jgi:hypothetical protein
MIVRNAEGFFGTDTVWNSLLTNTGTAATAAVTADSNATKALAFSKSISDEYIYVKWNLGHFDASEKDEQTYVDEFLASENGSEDMLTPINRYMVFSNINKTITPMNLTLSSGYKVWISKDDVVIGENAWEDRVSDSGEKSDFNSQGVVKGIVITEGDVTFTDDVTKFEGLIIAGGKIYVGSNLSGITASPEICRSVIKECMVVNDSTSKYIRSLFTQYRVSDDGYCPVCKEPLVEQTDEEGNVIKDADGVSIKYCATEGCTYNAGSENKMLVEVENIDYTDVCSMDNWNKSVE